MARTRTEGKTSDKSGTRRSRAAKPASQHAATSAALNTEQRRQMIAEAAYFRALERNFQGGDPVDDWLMAEREVAQRLPQTEAAQHT